MSYTGEGFLESLGIKQPTKIASYKPRTKTSGNKDYDALYDKYGREHNVDPDLLIAQGEQESGFRSNARSKAGAEGIAQFIPSTAKEFGVNVKDPASSINGQTRLMRQLLDRTNDIELSLAGYNSGHNASIDTLRRNKERIPETRNYVKSILGKYQTPSSTLVKDLNTPSFLDAIGANDVPQKSFLDEIGATEQQPPAVQSPAIAPLVNGQKPLLDPKTIGQQTVTTQTPVMQPIQPQNTQQTDVTGILAKQPQVMAEAQRIGKQPVDILLEMAKGEHPAQQSQQPIAEQQQQWLAKNPEYAKWTKEVGVDPFDEKSIANYKDVQKQNAQIQQQRKQKVGLVQQSVKAIERPNQGYEFEQTGELFVPNAQGVQNLRFKYDKTNQEGLQKGEYRVIDEDGDSYIFSPKTGNFIDEADTTVLETIPLPKPGKDVATKAAGLRTMATTVAESIADKYQIPKKDVADYFMQYGFGDIQTGKNRPDEWYFGGGANIVGTTDDTYQYHLTQRGLSQIQNFSAERAKTQAKYEEGKKLAKDLGYNDYEADLAGARDAGWLSKDAFKQEFDLYRKEKTHLESFQDYFSSIKGKGGYEPTTSNEQIVQQNLQSILDKYGSFREFNKEQKRIAALPLSERVVEAGRSFVAVVPKAFGAISKSLGVIDYGLSQLGLIPGQTYKDIESTPMWQSGQNFDWIGDWGKSKDAHNAWESKVADTIGQVALQAGTAWATGGIGLSSLIGLTQGGSQAVETAMKEGATSKQQLAMGIVGSIAALPDVLLMKGWFKSFTGANRVGLVKKIGQSIAKELILKGATSKEASLVSKLAMTGFVTRAGQLGQKILFNAEKFEPLTVGRATTTVLKGMAGEGIQEGSENDINLIGKKYIYNPNITWGDIAKITDDDVDSITYGAIGGAFGGSIEIASHPDAFKTYKEKQAAYAAIDKGLSNHALEKTGDTTFTLGKKEYKITDEIGDTIEKYQANASAMETALKSFADIKTRAKKAKTFAQRRELVNESKTLQKEIVTLADERASLASELINQADAGESLIQETQNTSATQDTPITQNIPIVGTDVKKKVVEVKPAVEPKIEEQPQEAQSKETRPKEEQPVEQEVAKQPIDEDVEDIVNTPADTDWVNKMLGVKKPVKKKTVTKKVEAPNVLENKAPTVKPAPVKPPQPSAKRLKDLGYTSSQQKTLTTAQKAEILDKAQIDTTKPTAKGDTFNPLAVQKNTPTLPDGTKVSWTNPQGLKSQGIVKNNKVEPVNGGAGIPIEKFAEKGIELKTRGNKGLAMSPSNIIDSKGNINYEQTKDVAERIERGELTIRRLNQEVERGRLAGGRRNVEASLILAANEGASKKANALRGSRVDSVTDTSRRQEGVLEHYAKRNDIWFKQGHFPDRLYIDKGGEAIVYRKDENRVVKLLDPRQIDKSLTPQTFLDTRVSLFNYLFPESRYEVMGFMRDDNGKFRVLVTQPFIQGEPVKQQADIDAFMESRGLKRTGKQSYSNDLYEVHDLHEKNVIKGNDGTIYVIDAVPKAKHVQDFEVVSAEDNLAMVVSDSSFYSRVESVIKDKMPAKATADQITALLAKNSVKELDPEMQALKVWLDGQNGTIRKEDVLEFVAANKNVVGEVVKTSDQFTLEDAENEAWDKLKDGGIYVLDDGSFIDRTKSGGWFVLHHDGGNTKYSDLETALDDAVEKGLLDITEKSDTKFDQFQLPGESENYREEFLTAPRTNLERAGQALKDFTAQFNSKPIPESHKAEYERLRQAIVDAKKPQLRPGLSIVQGKDGLWNVQERNGNFVFYKGAATREELENTIAGDTMLVDLTDWQDGHSDYDDIVNPIARIRYNDRTTTDGDKMLFAEEIQQPSKENLAKMPKVYQKFGEEMAIRKMLYRAVEGGYDYFGFTTGQQQADRYDLSKKVDRINVEATETDGVYFVDISPTQGDTIYLEVENDNVRSAANGTKGNDELGLTGKHLADVVGKDLAEKILAVPQGELDEFSGNDLKIGGQGLIARYDRKHVDYINKLMKPYGVEVTSKQIATGIKASKKGLTSAEKSDLRDLAKQVDDLPMIDFAEEYHAITGLTLTENQYEALSDLMRDPYRRSDAIKYFIEGANDDIKNAAKGDATVHAVRISPEFKKAVQDSIRDNGGAFALLKAPTGQDLLDALKKPVTNKQIQEAKSKVTKYGTEMDLTTAVIANRLAKDAGVTTLNFEGMFFEPKSTKRFIANVRKLADATGAKSLEKFANAVEHQFNTEGVAVVYMSDEAGKHETGHKERYLRAVNKGLIARHAHFDDLVNLKTDDGLDTIIDRTYTEFFVKHGYNRADKNFLGVAVEEIANYIAQGDYKKLGLTEDEAARFAILEAQSYYAANKGDLSYEEAVEKFAGLSDAMDKFLEALRNEQTKSGDIQNSQRPQENRTAEARGSEKADTEKSSTFTDDEIIRQLTGETIAESNQKNRRFAETMATSLMDIGQVPYDPQTFKGWTEGAFNILERNGIDKAVEIWRQMPMDNPETEGRRTALGTAIAIQMYNTGQQDALVPFGVELTTHVGNAAQELVAAKLMSRLSPVFASMHGDKYTLKSKKRVQTPDERAKTDKLAEKLQDVADNHDVASAAIIEAEQRMEAWAKQEKELNALLEAERKRNSDMETALTKAKQAVSVYKDSVSNTNLKTPKKLAKLKKEITAEEPELRKILEKAFPSSLAMAVRTAPPLDTHLTEDTFDALIKLGAKQLIDGLPKGLTPQEFDTYLQHLTRGNLTASELNYIHAMAFEMTKPTRSAMSAEKRALLANRSAHARRAKTILGVNPEQVLKQRKASIERQIAQIEEQLETGVIPTRTIVADTPELTALKAKRDALKQSLPQNDDIINRVRAKAIQKQIERLEARINGQEVVKAGKPKTNAEVEALKAKRKELQTQLSEFNKLQQTAKRHMDSEQRKAGNAYRDDKFAHTMLDVADSLNASEEAVLMAFSLRETPELKKLKAIYEKVVSNGKDFNKVLNEGKAILDQTYQAIEQQRDLATYGKDKTPEEIRLLKIFKDDQRNAERLAQKELEHHFENLKKPLHYKIGDTAQNLWNMTRVFQFGGDAGWLVAQGGLPLLMHTKAWGRSVKGVTPAFEAPALKRWLGTEGINLKIKNKGIHIPGANILSEGQGVVKTLRELVPNLDARLSRYGFTGQSLEHAITKVYDSAIRKQLESHGTKFELIGNIADFNENFMSAWAKKVPLIRQTNLMHNLATDLMRLNIGEELFGKIDKMYSEGKLTADESVAAKDVLARKWVNVVTGKGFTPGWTHGLFRQLANLGSAPSLALSSFQMLYYTNPARFAMMPKGARTIIAKKAGRMYGSLAILFGILGAIPGLINKDPEDKDFGVLDMGVVSPKLEGLKVNILRQLKEPVRLTLGLGFKKLYYDLTGNKEGSARIKDEWFQELVMNDYGGIGSFWKGKAHPSISYLNTLWTGKNFVGEPASTLDYIPVTPLIVKEGVQSATYDKKANILKNGQSGSLNDNWVRFLTTIMTNQIGFGANSYESTDTTTSQKQIRSMMTGDDRSELEKMQSQKANQYERLIRDGFTKNDLESDMLADVQAGNLTPKQVGDLIDIYQDELFRFQAKYGVSNLSASQKQTLMANRRAFKILDYVWGGEPYKMNWEKVNAALKFATPAENKLNDREAQAIAEGIILEALLKSPKMSAPRKDSPYPVRDDNPRKVKLEWEQKNKK